MNQRKAHLTYLLKEIYFVVVVVVVSQFYEAFTKKIDGKKN